ncbi:MAG: ABC transporter substrate-binding protein [Candidatus Limimorpha sp.]
MKKIRGYLFISLSLLLLSCSSGGGNGDDVVIASLRGPSSLGMLRVIDSISVPIFNEPLQVRKMMLDSSADFAVLPSNMAALLFNKGLDYRLVAVSTWGTLYLCGSDDIGSWDDLRGRKVYLMAKGMTPDVLFRHLLIKNGLTPYQDVDLDYRFPTHIDLANATTAGIAGISVISEPYLSYALLKNPSLKILMSLHDEWEKAEGTTLPETAFVCKGEILDNNPELVDRLVDAYRRSAEWVNGNLGEAAELAVKHGIIADTAAARLSIPRSNLKVVDIRDARDNMERYLKILYDFDPNIIGGRILDERYYR